MKDFREKLSLVPELPGSYQMKNKDGVIIYVGKAKNLKAKYNNLPIKERLALDRKSTRLNSSHTDSSRMPSSA